MSESVKGTFQKTLITPEKMCAMKKHYFVRIASCNQCIDSSEFDKSVYGTYINRQVTFSIRNIYKKLPINFENKTVEFAQDLNSFFLLVVPM